MVTDAKGGGTAADEGLGRSQGQDLSFEKPLPLQSTPTPSPGMQCPRGQDVVLLRTEPTAATSRKQKVMAQSPPGPLQPCLPAELGLQELQSGLDLPWPAVTVQGHVLRAVHQRDVLQRLRRARRLPVLPEGEHVWNVQGSGWKERRHLSTCLASSSPMVWRCFRFCHLTQRAITNIHVEAPVTGVESHPNTYGEPSQHMWRAITHAHGQPPP